MRVAIAEAERARGGTGDNPWVGSVIVDPRGLVVAHGYTQGPGEDHAEIVALRAARAAAVDLTTTTLYSTLEPCAFHGRTPACATAIANSGVRRVVVGILDPNPRVDGVGLRMLRDAQLEVIGDVCADEITRQLSGWLFSHHPREPLRRARALLRAPGATPNDVAQVLQSLYGLDRSAADALVTAAR